MTLTFSTAGDVERQARLRRMKLLALSFLLFAAVLYLATLRLDHSGAWGYVNSAAEAGMVGALADWFAVTALFRHPLGIPIPHTSIIARKKDDVAGALENFFAENFLTPEVVSRRILSAGVARRLGEWLEKPEHAQRVVQEASRAGRAMLDRVSDDEVKTIAQEVILPRLASEPLAAPLGGLLEGIVRDGAHHGVIELGINEIGRWLLDHPDSFERAVGRKAPKWAPDFVNQRVATWGYKQVVEWLIEVRDNLDHPARVALDDLLRTVADDLRHDEAVQAKFEGLKQRLFEHPETADMVLSLWRAVRTSLTGSLAEEGSPLRVRAEAAVARIGRSLADEPAWRERVDHALADAASFVVTSYGRELSGVISDTIKRWDGEETSRKIELHVGRDLQFIRINGTVVGALAGLGIHAISQLVG